MAKKVDQEQDGREAAREVLESTSEEMRELAARTPIHTREDLGRYEQAEELALELTAAAIMENAKLEIAGTITRAEASARARVLGIITACVAFTTAEVRLYVHNFERAQRKAGK